MPTVQYQAYSPADPTTGEFKRLLPYAGEVDVDEDADPQAVLAAIEAVVNELAEAEPGAQVRIVTEIDGQHWTHTYDVPVEA
jgi:hypothetical protein